MKEYILTEKDIEYLENALYSPKHSRDNTVPEESIMVSSSSYNYYKSPDKFKLNNYNKKEVCTCNDGYLCEHRVNWLLDFIESKELKTRKRKLKNLNED
jgi:hypothetical protein